MQKPHALLSAIALGGLAIGTLAIGPHFAQAAQPTGKVTKMYVLATASNNGEIEECG